MRAAAGSLTGTSSELDAFTLAAAQRGEPEACRRLVLRHQGAVHALVWRMLAGRGDPSTIEDLIQETFLRAFRALPRFRIDGPARLSTWLLGIATRTVIDGLRRQRLRVTAGDTWIGRAPPSDDADALALRREIARAIEAAVESLGPEVRAVFVLRCYHERSYEEIAAVLEIDLGTVKSRLHRARTALQRRLQEVRR